MAPKYHPTPLSGGDRKLNKELGKARAMANILATRSAEMRVTDKLLCESWNERMWSDGEPIDPSPTIDQAVNGGFPRLEIQCARCKTPSDVDLAAMKHPPTTFVHDRASRLRCRKCAKAGRRPAATLLQLAWQPRHPRTEARTMCNLYSITTNQAAIIALFRVVNRYVGNLPPMPGVFPDYKAPIVRNGADGRELATARWGMPSSQHALMEATKKRAAKLEANGKQVDFNIAPDGAR